MSDNFSFRTAHCITLRVKMPSSSSVMFVMALVLIVASITYCSVNPEEKKIKRNLYEESVEMIAHEDTVAIFSQVFSPTYIPDDPFLRYWFILSHGLVLMTLGFVITVSVIYFCRCRG